ncbi:hypothetical protein ACMFMG_002991 [Clarireedia jacksonii]
MPNSSSCCFSKTAHYISSLQHPKMSTVGKSTTKKESECQGLCQKLASSSLDDHPTTSSVSFHLLPDFPLEIRQLIWRHAFSEPQLHIVSSKFATYSRISVIMQSCREAFQEGFRLRLPYYTFCEYSKWTESHRHGPLPRHYMQPDLDTLWIVENSHCGQYPSFIPQSLSFYAGHHPYRRVKTVAFNDSCWTDPARLSDNTWNTGSLQWIPYDMCEEIVVVLNNWPMSTDRGVIFTESVPATKDSISVDTPSADGDGESKNYFDEAKQRSALMEEFKAYYSKLQERMTCQTHQLRRDC